MAGPLLGAFVCRGATDDAPHALFTPTLLPDYGPGDREFLDPDPSRLVQIRPVLAAECPQRKLIPADRVVVCRAFNGLPPMYALVRLKPFQCENTPQNVEKAIWQLADFDQSIADHCMAAFRASTQHAARRRR
ncbi:hypothetical protein [Enterovirga sp. CN4-39]|uniref:hypothetical protein n=1 Tax=Enterovirga sp. CN4-39 TaxID=3400910 RepID=UPI003C0F4081